jgi:hypothetical protein
MAELDDEIGAYERLRPELEASATGKWVVVQGGQLVGTFDDFEAAAEDAVRRFGRGPYLIRQVGAPPVTIPASVMYPLRHADN